MGGFALGVAGFLRGNRSAWSKLRTQRQRFLSVVGEWVTKVTCSCHRAMLVVSSQCAFATGRVRSLYSSVNNMKPEVVPETNSQTTLIRSRFRGRCLSAVFQSEIVIHGMAECLLAIRRPAIPAGTLSAAHDLLRSAECLRKSPPDLGGLPQSRTTLDRRSAIDCPNRRSENICQ